MEIKMIKNLSNKTFLLILILAFIFILRIPFLAEPLDYDEGTYAFFAFFSKGVESYSSFPIMKFPGIIFTYRFLDDLFPGQIASFRILATIFLAAGTFGIYKLGKLLYNQNTGLFAALFFTLFATQISLFSPANTEFFMTPLMILSVWLFWVFQKSKKTSWLVLSGLLSGMAILYKQVAIFEVGYLVLWLFLAGLKDRNTFNVLAGKCALFIFTFLVPFLITLLFFLLRGELADFWYQTFGSGNQYIFNSWQTGGVINRFLGSGEIIFFDFWPLFLAAFTGLLLVIFWRREENSFLIGWLFFSFIGVSFNGWFFDHYFLQVFPSLAILGGFTVEQILVWAKRFRGQGKILNILSRMTITAVFILLILGSKLFFYLTYFKLIDQASAKRDYFSKVFLANKESWLPFYESADFLEEKMADKDSVFVWGTTPLPYYLLRKYPTTSNVFYYPVLDYRFMLPTYRGYKFNFEANRQILIRELAENPPTYIIFHVTPDQVFDQMTVFADFSRLLSQNYELKKQFTDILVFKIKEEADQKEFIRTDSVEIHQELVKRYSAISSIQDLNGQTAINFEPMVNPVNSLPSFRVIYPEDINISWESTAIEILGQDGVDLVGARSYGPSGTLDLHFQIKAVEKPINLVRIRSGNLTWSNKGYGVGLVIGITQSDKSTDFYMEPPPNWQERKFEVYIIYQDGTLAKTEIKKS